jgi:hypothetical protein
LELERVKPDGLDSILLLLVQLVLLYSQGRVALPYMDDNSWMLIELT